MVVANLDPMTSIKPTGPFLHIHFVPGSGSTILLPDGTRDPNGDIVVLAVGPDVPPNQGIVVGSKLLLRGDAKIFGTTSEERGPACIDYRSVMAVVADDEVPMTDAQIDTIAGVNATQTAVGDNSSTPSS